MRITAEEFPLMIGRLNYLRSYWEAKILEYTAEYENWKELPFYRKIFSVSPKYKVGQAEDMISWCESHKKLFLGTRSVYICYWLYNEILNGGKKHLI